MVARTVEVTELIESSIEEAMVAHRGASKRERMAQRIAPATTAAVSDLRI